MSHHEHDEAGSREERITMTPAELSDGFAAVMARVQSMDEPELQQRRERVEQTVLGYDAYALGREHLDREEYEQATRWLQMAARYGVEDAQRDLDGMPLCQALQDTAPHIDDEEADLTRILQTTMGEEADALFEEARIRVEERLTEVEQHADKLRTDAECRARQTVETAQRQAKDIVADANAKADRIRSESERELTMLTNRRDHLNTQLTHLVAMLLAIVTNAAAINTTTINSADADVIDAEIVSLDEPETRKRPPTPLPQQQTRPREPEGADSRR